MSTPFPQERWLASLPPALATQLRILPCGEAYIPKPILQPSSQQPTVQESQNSRPCTLLRCNWSGDSRHLTFDNPVAKCFFRSPDLPSFHENHCKDLSKFKGPMWVVRGPCVYPNPCKHPALRTNDCGMHALQFSFSPASNDQGTRTHRLWHSWAPVAENTFLVQGSKLCTSQTPE